MNESESESAKTSSPFRFHDCPSPLRHSYSLSLHSILETAYSSISLSQHQLAHTAALFLC